ncbi:unnamed protein product [Lepeophtheirus salmonis]|uniref:(salmon louse) hypothetical protein n=1 Tax=Lepeophtheirus salmonis TaxID=72036 RepID=A0A7R8CTJ6_LEPSM|nr:unnamed protein product [Lepeophtheirus salmonis]CAF2927093.1 unnamed protein product [Lepeophtheirus salmonis]
MPGFTEAILFQKLKECLEEPALSLVSVFASCSPSAYREAIKCLTESYEDPIKLANPYLLKATDPSQDEATMANSILKSSQALQVLKDDLINQKIDMYEFALMHVFLGAMPPKMKADWEGHKYKCKQDYLHEFERKNKSEECMEAWTAGRVENLSSFSSWLKLYKGRIPNSKAADSPSTATKEFIFHRVNGLCFCMAY